jgi:hypothetical protein
MRRGYAGLAETAGLVRTGVGAGVRAGVGTGGGVGVSTVVVYPTWGGGSQWGHLLWIFCLQ